MIWMVQVAEASFSVYLHMFSYFNIVIARYGGLERHPDHLQGRQEDYVRSKLGSLILLVQPFGRVLIDLT